MFLKPKKDLPFLRKKVTGHVYIAVVASSTKENFVKHINTKTEVENLPSDTKMHLTSPEGAFLELPLDIFKDLFDIAPDGILTEVLYDD